MNRRQLLGATLAAAGLAAPAVARAQQAITLNGASQFNDDHVFTRALVRFEELVKRYYTAGPVNFVLHKNSSLGLEKQYFEYMSAGRGAVGQTPLGLLAVPEALRVAGVPSPRY
jgi:TRAP-type C4-dicarboxylate transport system substrate-binding protein